MGRNKAKAQELYNSLIAILQTAPASATPLARWKAIAPAMAVQVFRFTNAPPQALPIIEGNITSLVCDVHSGRYRELEEYFLGKLMAELAKVVKQFRGLSGVSLFSVASGGQQPQGSKRAWDGTQERDGESMAGDGSIREAKEEEGIEDMATRLAHLGTLHWRVWAGLVYSDDGDVSMEQPTHI